MKSQFFPLYSLFILAFFLISNSATPPDGRTGAPGDGTCTNCHTGNNPNNFEGTLEILGLPDQLEPNATYNLTIKTTKTNGEPIRAGVQLVALDADNNNSGNFNNVGASSSLKVSGDRTYFGHKPALRFEEANAVSWTVYWTAPTDITKEITFYANSILGNGSSSNGDLLLSASLSKSVQTATEPIMTTIDFQNVSCFGGEDGAITFEVSGGSGNYTYEWSNGEKEANIANLTAGDYAVTVSDDAGESATASITISEPDMLEITVVDITNIDCNNPIGFATVATSGGNPEYNYKWANIEGPSVSLAVGQHEVTVTDGNGCTQTTSVTIDKDVLLPQVNAGPSKEIDCKGPVIDLEGNGSQGEQFSYLWTTSNGSILSGENTLTPTIETGGIYTLLVRNTATGCSASSQVEVRENLVTPLANAGNNKQLSCAEETTSLDGSISSIGDSFEYEWTTTDGNISNGNTSLAPTVNQSGTYTLKVTDTTNGCISTATVSVLQDVNMPSAIAGEPQSLNCNTTQLTLNGNGSAGVDFIYSWETEDGKIESGENTLNPIISEPGTYRLTVRNRTNGCDASSSVVVAGAQGVVAIVNGNAALSCASNVTTTLSGVGSSEGENVSYEWSTTDGTIISDNNISIINVDSPGTYRLTVKNNANGCEAMAEIVVVQEEKAPELTVVPTAEINCENPTITLQASLAEVNENLSIQWQTENGNILEGQGTLTPVVSDAGTYNIGVFDTATGCITTASVNITKSEETLSIEIDNMKTGGEATAMVSGGTPPYSYKWDTSPMDTDATIMNMPNGEYTLTVTDAIGCSSIATAVIIGSTSVPSIPSLTAIEVYPNPTYEGVYLNAAFNNKETGNITVFSSLGMQVWQQDFDTNTIQVRIETNQWEGGVYYLRVQTEEGINVEEIVLLK